MCHTIVVHPPGGIAGGDELAVEARAAQGAHALLTTPGAGRWYRSAGPWARQTLAFEARDGACLEWLPQETIVFDGALADLRTEVRLAGDARLHRLGGAVPGAHRLRRALRARGVPARARSSGATDGCCGRSAGASRPAAP